jgi:hypothetical protein
MERSEIRDCYGGSTTRFILIADVFGHRSHRKLMPFPDCASLHPGYACFGKIIVSETEKWEKVVKFAGAKVD